MDPPIFHYNPRKMALVQMEFKAFKPTSSLLLLKPLNILEFLRIQTHHMRAEKESSARVKPSVVVALQYNENCLTQDSIEDVPRSVEKSGWPTENLEATDF